MQIVSLKTPCYHNFTSYETGSDGCMIIYWSGPWGVGALTVEIDTGKPNSPDTLTISYNLNNVVSRLYCKRLHIKGNFHLFWSVMNLHKTSSHASNILYHSNHLLIIAALLVSFRNRNFLISSFNAASTSHTTTFSAWNHIHRL